jgi:hypothetical protein
VGWTGEIRYSTVESGKRRVARLVARRQDIPCRFDKRDKHQRFIVDRVSYAPANTRSEKKYLAQLAFLCDALIRLAVIVDAIFELAIPLG